MYMWDYLTQQQRDGLITEQTTSEEADIERCISGSYAFDDAVSTRTVEQIMVPLTEAYQRLIDFYLDTSNDARERARLPQWIEPALNLGGARVAYLFARSLVHVSASGPRRGDDQQHWSDPYRVTASKQEFCIMFAESVWDMAAFFTARNEQPFFYKEQSRYFRNWDPRRRKAFAKKIDALPKWTKKQKMQFATAFLEMAEQVGVAEIPMRWEPTDKPGEYNSVTYVRPSVEVMQQIRHNEINMEAALLPTRMPMVCRPIDITPESYGGWRSEDMRKRSRYVTGYATSAIAGRDDDDEIIINHRPTLERHSDASRKTINTLQHTEWAVNTDVLDVMMQYWRVGTAVGKIPERTPEFEFIERLADDATEEEIKAHKKRKADAYAKWYRDTHDRVNVSTLLNVALKLKGRTVWHSWFCDFRGRFYCDTGYLNPQGDDLNKALLKFAQPYKVTNVGIYWLMVALANEFGYDKASFDDRVRWVKERMDLWRAIVADPYGTVRDWEDDSKLKNTTFQRLARVLDLVKAIDTGYSSMPVNLDGSCNGVQHWAAITRDLPVAEKVNLTPGDKPQDLYQFVADGCTELCHDEPNPWRIQFLDHYDGKIGRKVCKRSVMCDPYGLSDHSVGKYIRLEGHMDWVPKEQRQAATNEMRALVCASKAKQMEFINHGKEFVTWLTKWVVAETEQAFWWTAPNGFEVISFYPKMERVNCSIHVWNQSFDQRYNVQTSFSDYSDEADVRKSSQTMPPNFIHSVDAAHMSLTINKLADAGVEQYAFIHDSFGCPAEDVPLLRDTIKETFYEIHQHDLLSALAKHAEAVVGRQLTMGHPIWEHDRRGDYDPRQIFDSEYAFG